MSGDKIEMVSEEAMLEAEGDCFVVAADVLGLHQDDEEEWFIVHACECVHRSVQHDHIGCAVIGCDCPATNPRSTDE